MDPMLSKAFGLILPWRRLDLGQAMDTSMYGLALSKKNTVAVRGYRTYSDADAPGWVQIY